MAGFRSVVLIHMASSRGDGTGPPPAVSTLRVENHVAPPEATDLQSRLDVREAELREAQREIRNLRRRAASRAPRESASQSSSSSPSDEALGAAQRRAQDALGQLRTALQNLAAAERRASLSDAFQKRAEDAEGRLKTALERVEIAERSGDAALRLRASEAETRARIAEKKAEDASVRLSEALAEKAILQDVVTRIGRSNSSSHHARHTADTATSGQRSSRRRDVVTIPGDEPLSQRRRLDPLRISGNQDDTGTGPSQPAP